MRSAHTGWVSWRFRQAASILGIVALSVLTTPLVQHVLTPPQASAQPSQFEEIRAARFVLVGRDGTTLAILETAPAGDGRLQLFDAAGNLRVGLAGQGALNVFDPDGTTQRFRAGHVPEVDPRGRPPMNGVWLDGNGSISIVPAGTVQR